MAKRIASTSTWTAAPDLFGGLFQDGSISKALLSKGAESASDDSESNVASRIGVQEHLLDKFQLRALRDVNATHSICMDAKISGSMGLGHRSKAIYDALDPLCLISWQSTLDAINEDFWEGADGYLEVVYDEDFTEIQFLSHIDGTRVHVEIEDPLRPTHFHYVVRGDQDTEQVIMAPFGKSKQLRERLSPDADGRVSVVQRFPSRVRTTSISGRLVNSEIIHFPKPTNRSRHYGFIDYLAAVPAIELTQCMTQGRYDFYFNRGVPEFLLFLKGHLEDGVFDDIQKLIRANQGLRNSHKSGLVHLAGDPEATEIQLEKLAMESGGDSNFSEENDTLSGLVATAHGVPPGLANLILSGKIGANNETLNMLLLLQKRKLGKAQAHFSCILGRTLGSGVPLMAPSGNGTTKLTKDQFLGRGIPEVVKGEMGGLEDENGLPIYHEDGNGFKTLLDGLSLGAQESIATMREQMVGSQRNPAEGTLSSGSDRRSGSAPRRTQ